MIYFIIIEWILSVLFLTMFFKSTSDMRELLFLGSLGAPLTLPMITLLTTYLYFFT